MSYYVNTPEGGKIEFADDVPRNEAMQSAISQYYSKLHQQSRLPVDETAPTKPQSTAGLGSDIVGSLIRGGGSLVELPGNVYGLATGNFDNPLTRAGHEIQQYGESFYSPAMRAAQQNIEETQKAVEGEGGLTQFLSTSGAYFRNPRALFGAAVEQGPMLAATMGGGLAARAGAAGIRGLAGRQLTGKAAEAAAARAGTVGAVGTGAVMQGADVAGDTYKEMMGQDQEVFDKSEPYRRLVESGLKPEEAKQRLALEAAREAGLLSGAASAALGAAIPGVERIPFTQASKAGIVRRVLTGGTQEFLQEGIEEGSGKYLSNLALSRVDEQRDLMRGVGSAAAAGALPGGILGGAGHALHRAPREVPSTRGENPELRAAIEESRSIANVNTPIGELQFNDAFNLYSKRYPNITNITQNEDEVMALGSALMQKEIQPILDKIDALKQQLEIATPNEEKRIEGQIKELEDQLPTLENPKRGYRKPYNLREVYQALNELREVGIPQTYRAPNMVSPTGNVADPYRIIDPAFRLEAPKPIPTPTKFFWRSDDLGGFDIPIDLSGLAYTAQDGRKFFRATVLNSNQEMSIPADQVIAEPGAHETTEPRTVPPEPYKAPAGPDVSTAAQRPTSFRAAFPENEIVSERTIPPEDVYRRMGGYKRPQEAPKTTTEEQTVTKEDEGGRWRPTSPDEVHPPGRKFRMNTTTGQSEVFEPNVAQREEVKTPTAEEPVAPKPKTSKATTSATTGTDFTKTSRGKRLLGKIDAAVAANDEAAIRSAQQEYQAALQEFKTKGAGTTTGESQSAAEQAVPAEAAASYAEVPRQTEWTGESQFAVAPESTQAAPEATTEAPTTPPPPVTLKANKVIEDFLSGLEKRGKFGKQSAEELRRNLADRQLNNNQVYAAFLAAEQANNLLPQTADHRLEFVKKLYGNDMKAAAKSGASNVNAVGKLQQVEAQGERIAPKKLPNGTVEQGIIRISLAENMLAAIQETTAHEAYHVLQDYYSKYDSDFRKLIDSKFVATHDLVDANGQPIIGKDNKPVKGMYISEIDQSIIDKLSKFRHENGESYWTNLSNRVKNLVSVEEAQAYAFASLHDANSRGMPIANLVPAYRRFINFLRNFFSNIKKSLRRDGYKTFSDVFGEARTEGFEGKAAPSKETVTPQYSVGDVSQYALRPPAAAGASVLERVTGEHYSKPSIFDRALGKIFGAKQGESFKSAAWRTIVNRTYPVYVLEDLMRSQGKWTGRAVAKAMEMALNNTGRIQTLLDHGLIKYNKNTGDVEFVNGSKALRDIFGGRVPDSLKKEFQLYGVALRERDLRKNGKKGFFNITDKEVADTIQKYEAAHPEWKNVAADLQKFNEGLIQFALDTGTIDQKTAAKLNSMFYTPYYRQMQTDVDGAPEQVLGPSLTRSLNNPRVFAHPLKGGSEAIGDLYENIIRNADSIIRAGMKNVAMRDASKLLQIANLATPTNHAGTRDERVITFRDNGKPVHFRIDDPVLWSAIGGLPAQQRHGILKAMDRVARFFRDAVTLSPRFMLANLWRGKIVAYAQEGQPLYSNTFSGLVDGLKGGEASRNIAAITGFGGYSYGMGERDVAKNFSRKMRIAGGEASMFDRVMQGINAVQHFSEATEMAERVNIYNRMIAEGKTQGEAAWAAYQFAPFSRSGSGEGGIGAVLHSLMPMIPFLNAKVQGLARIIEGQPGDKRFLGLPKQLMLRGMLITAFSVAAAALARSSDPDAWDKESIQNIMNYDILGYVNGNPITLPRGFEPGTLFGALPVFIVRKFTQERGDDMGKVLREAILNTFGFDPLPPAIKPMIEVAANRNFFRGMPIESLSQQKMPAGARVSPTTSETAKLLSGAINASGVPGLFDAQMSPVKAQHLIEGYLGTVGATLVSIVDNIAGASGLLPSKPMGAFGDPYSIPAIAAQTAGLDVFYRSGLNRADRFVNDFYKLERDVNEIYTFLRDAQKNNDTQSLNRMLEEHRIPLSMHKALNNASDQISKINERIDFVRRADSISMEDKTEELGKLQKLKSNIARQMIMQAERIGAIQ